MFLHLKDGLNPRTVRRKASQGSVVDTREFCRHPVFGRTCSRRCQRCGPT